MGPFPGPEMLRGAGFAREQLITKRCGAHLLFLFLGCFKCLLVHVPGEKLIVLCKFAVVFCFRSVVRERAADQAWAGM